MKKVFVPVLVCVLMLSIICTAGAEGGKTRIVVWSFTNELQGMIEKYYAPAHPEIEFTFAIYPTDGSAYVTRLNLLLNADPTSSEAPDIFALEASFVKKFVNSEVTGNLNQVGITDQDTADAFAGTAQVGQNTAGVQKALSWQSTPGVLMYRASLAEKYLGVTSPEEMQQRVSSWDAFLETAEELKAKSGGRCKMVSGTGDVWQAYQYCRSLGWVADNTVTVDGTLMEYEELCRTLEADGLTQKASSWSETWYAGMRGEVETLCYFLPTWGLQWVLKPGCCIGGSDAVNEEDLEAMSAEQNGTYGDWRMTVGPTSYLWGGTWICTNAAKVNAANAAKKAIIGDIIHFFTLDKDFLAQYAADSGDFVSTKSATENILDNGGSPSPFLGGQDPIAVFAQAANLADGSMMSEYDDNLSSLWNTYVTTPYSMGEMGLEECLENFRRAVAEAYTGFQVQIDDASKLTISTEDGTYKEIFRTNSGNQYFVLPLGTKAELSLKTVPSNTTYDLQTQITGNTIRINNGIITPVAAGVSRVTAWAELNGEEIDNTRITAGIVVINPQKILMIPASAQRIEADAFKGIKAECVIIPGSARVLESGCFADCPNLKTVIWTGDPSGIQILSPFGQTQSILFLSGNGLMPQGFAPANTGMTGFTGIN